MNDLLVAERFKKAISIRDKGDLHGAILEFQQIVDLNPNHPKIGGILIVLAGVYQDVGDHNNAKLYFKKATEINPKSELASLGLYLSHIKLFEYEEAMSELERFLTQYPADRYRTTLSELIGDLEQGFAANFKEMILKLALKHNVKLGVG